MDKVLVPDLLMAQVAKGDHGAFEQLYILTYRPVYAFLLSLTLNQDDAKDLMQETYIRVHGSAHLYKGGGNVMAWIMKIAKNLFLMEQRKRCLEQVYLEDYMSAEGDIPFDDISRFETREFFKELFTKLDDDERNIVILHVVAGFKHREIAELLNHPVGTVTSKYKRAIAKLSNFADKIKKGAE